MTKSTKKKAKPAQEPGDLSREALTDYRPLSGRTIVAVGPFCWGRGETVAEALRKAREHYSRSGTYRGSGYAVLFDAPVGTYVSDMGGLCWKLENDPQKRGAKRIGTLPMGARFRAPSFQRMSAEAALALALDLCRRSQPHTVFRAEVNGTRMAARADLFVIKRAWEAGVSFEQEADGFGPGLGTMRGDWSGIRDSSEEATAAMLAKAMDHFAKGIPAARQAQAR